MVNMQCTSAVHSEVQSVHVIYVHAWNYTQLQHCCELQIDMQTEVISIGAMACQLLDTVFAEVNAVLLQGWYICGHPGV
jgi:putative methionine-R-sulfoxide reductase with GAF domain